MPRTGYIVIFLCLSLLRTDHLRAAPDEDLFTRVVTEEKNHNIDTARSLCRELLKKYPRSTLVPHARLVLADTEPAPEKALAQFRSIINNYRYFDRNDYAQFRICEIRHLTANWNALKDESLIGLERYPRSAYAVQFRLFLLAAEVKMYRYDSAEEAARSLTEKTHEYDLLARALLYRAYISRKKDGYSRSYIYTLRELLLGFRDSPYCATILFLLGDFYDHTGDPGRALSAFEDLEKQFPRSPEAGMMVPRLAELRRTGTKGIPYYPDEKIVQDAQSIDLSPDIPLGEADETDTFFAVSIGPFDSPERAADIRKLLKEFEPVNTVRLREGFIHYVGKSTSLDRALSVKIRLAEELGINGNIVRVSGRNGSLYIYGE